MANASAGNLSESTRLAVDRTRLAHDRTLMAWVRTATSLISFGFTIYKFFQYLRDSAQGARDSAAISPRSFALMMIGIGIGSLAIAVAEHRRDMRALRAQFGGAVPRSLATLTAALMAALGIGLFLAVWFRL